MSKGVGQKLEMEDLVKQHFPDQNLMGSEEDLDWEALDAEINRVMRANQERDENVIQYPLVR